MEKHDKQIEDLINKLMAADKLEQAPNGFTDNVMSKIEGIVESKPITYKPLIPKYVWWLIALGFAGLFGYFFFTSTEQTVGILERYNLPELSFNLVDGLSFNFSSTLMYAVVFFVIMLSIQIPLLKHYFNTKIMY